MVPVQLFCTGTMVKPRTLIKKIVFSSCFLVVFQAWDPRFDVWIRFLRLDIVTETWKSRSQRFSCAETVIQPGTLVVKHQRTRLKNNRLGFEWLVFVSEISLIWQQNQDSALLFKHCYINSKKHKSQIWIAEEPLFDLAYWLRERFFT